MTDAVLFWAVAVIVTGFVLMALVPPLLGRRARSSSRPESARALYGDQLRRVDADVAQGRLTEAEAEGVRTDLGRRLLRTADTPVAATPRRSGRARGWAAAVIVAAPLSAVGLYLAIGQPGLPDQPITGRKDVADAAQLQASAETLVSEMTLAVERNPDDLRSRVWLARALATLNRFDEAADAYANAVAMAPDQADLSAAFGEVLVRQSGGQVTERAEQAFLAALALVPDDPRAQYYLALMLYQRGDLTGAFAGWTRLAAESPPDAPWMEAVRSRLAETEGMLGDTMVAMADTERGEADNAGTQRAVGATAAAGAQSGMGAGSGTARDNPGEAATEVASAIPAGAAEDAPMMSSRTVPPPISQQQAEEVLALSPEEQQERIAGMVAGLAARLQADPEDVDGWMILARSQVVLGNEDAAETALQNAIRYGPDRVDAQLAYARMVLEGQPLDAPVPAEAVAAFNRVIEQDPTHPDALWFLGLAAAQNRDFVAARAHWQRLLDTLDPESESYVDVQSYIAALSAGQEAAQPATATPPVDSANAAEPAEAQ